MRPEDLKRLIEENPEVVLAIMEMLMNMNEEQLQQLQQTLQMMVEQKQGGQQPQAEEEQSMQESENLVGY
jgi:DNA/RNA-binding domain of Phe-tRNA-synthetase-like protein